MKKLLTLLFVTFFSVFNQLNANPAEYIITASDNGSIQSYDPDTDTINFTESIHSSAIRDLQIGENENIYTASDDATVKKSDSSGNLIWTFSNHSSGVNAVFVDTNDNVYSGSGDNTVRKIDTSGNQVWSFTNHTSSVFDVVVDDQGNVYSGSNDNTVRKIDSTGNQVWSYSTADGAFTLAIDDQNNIYVGDADGYVYKLDSNGNLIFSVLIPGGIIRDLTIDNSYNIYIGQSDGVLRKLDSTGSILWTSNTDFWGNRTVFSIFVDGDGNIFATSSGFGEVYLNKLDTNGNLLISYTGMVGTTIFSIDGFAAPPEPPEYDVELQTNTPYNDFIYQDDEVNVTTDSVITTILNDEEFTVTSTAVTTGSYTFNYWYDLDNMEVFTTDRNFTIEDPDRDYNLIADYTLDSFNTFNIDSNLPSPENFTFNTFTLENEVYFFNQTEFNNYQHPDDRDWEIIAPINDIGFYEFDYYYDNDSNDIYDFNHIITGSGFSPPNLTAVYSLPEEYQINLIIESDIGDIIFQHGENDPISGPFISKTIGLGDDWTATAPNNVDYQFRDWVDLNDFREIFSTNQTINISNTQKDYYLEATYWDLVDINWDSNGGTQIPQQTVIIESSIEPPNEPLRPGFIFDYWEDSNNNEVQFPKTITEDVTFTAVWIETFNLNYDTNGGGLINPDTYLENEVPEVVTPSRFGYEFNGWYTDDTTFQNEYDFTDPITVDTTIHAKWQFGSDRDASLSLTTFLDDNDLGDGFSQIIIMTALYIFINVIIYVYSGPLVVTLILNFILSSIFLILGWIPMWIIIVIFIGLFGFIYLSSSGRGAME